MSARANKTIDDIQFNVEKPTQVSFSQLHAWIIWQFPRPRDGKLCGAVHPPLAEYGWLPAIIDARKQKATIYAHLGATFGSPEAAAEQLP